MKKILVTLLLGMSITLVACGNDESTEVITEEVVAEVEEMSEIEEVNELDVNQVELNGTVLTLGMDVTEDVISNLGEVIEVMEAPSCHYDGNDTIYTYEDVILYVYQDGDSNLLYIIEIVDSTITTNTGVTVGMSREEVVEIYGEQYDEYGTIVEYTFDETIVAVSFDENGLASYIEIF